MKIQIAKFALLGLITVFAEMGCSNSTQSGDLRQDSNLNFTNEVSLSKKYYEILVKTKTSLTNIPVMFAGYQILVEKSSTVSVPRNVYLLVVRSSETIEQILIKIKNDPNVILAQKNNVFGSLDSLIETETKCIKWQGSECTEDETTYKVGDLSCTGNCAHYISGIDKCIVKNACFYQLETNCFTKMLCQIPNVFGPGCLKWEQTKICK